MLKIIDINLFGLVIYQTFAFSVLFFFLTFSNRGSRALPFLSILFFISAFYQLFIYLFYNQVDTWVTTLMPFFQTTIILILPTAFYYIKATTSEKFNPYHFYYHIIIPLIVSIIFYYFYLKVPPALRGDLILQKSIHSIPSYYGLFYTFVSSSVFLFTAQFIYYFARTLQLVQNYKKLVYKYLSTEENINTTWAYNLPFLFALLYLLVILNVVFFTRFSDEFRVFYNMIQFFAVTYWGIHGLLNVSLVEIKNKPILIPEPMDVKTHNNKEIKNHIHFLMQNKKYFKDDDFTLRKLAQVVAINQQTLSKIINQEFKMNFFNFVNHYRVEEAKKRLTDPNNHTLSMEGIGLDCGFKSKATFYRVFKNMTGMSPKEYMLKNKKASQKRGS